jgi:hypothetical protein
MAHETLSSRLHSPITKSNTAVPSPHDEVAKSESPTSNMAPSTTGDVQFEFINNDEISSEDEEIDRKRSRETEDVKNERNSLIEDIYSVERREDQPKKRVKTTDTETSLVKKNSQFDVSGNSDLGDYMKEGKQSSQTTTPVVDLTSGVYNFFRLSLQILSN